jgi:hypothetical protein
MAAKKAPAKKMAAPAKAAPKKTGSAAQLRMKEERDKKNLAGRSKPTRTLTRAESTAMGKGMAKSNRRDVYGNRGFGQTEMNTIENYRKTVEAVGRSALASISGKTPRKNKEYVDGYEPLHGSETQTVRDQAIKGLKLTGAQRRYVEQMMEKVPYRPKPRKRK